MGISIPLGGGGGSSGGSTNYLNVWEQEAGSSAPSAATNTKRGFLDSEKDNVPSFIDDAGAVTIIDEFIDTPQTTLANLETNFPAADNVGLFGWVAGTTSANGLYLSTGSWEKQLDSVGDQTELPGWSGGISYTGSNIMAAAGTSYARNNADSSDTTIVSGAAADFFDGSTATYLQTGTPFPALVYKIPTTPFAVAAGQFNIKAVNASMSGNSNLRAFEIIGRTGAGVIEAIAPLSGSTSLGTGVSFSAGTNGMSQIDIAANLSNSEVITINTANVTIYEAYGIRIVTAGVIYFYMSEFEAIETVDNTALITTTKEVRTQYRGRSAIVSTAVTATPTTLDETSNVVTFDTSGGAITCNLPAVADVEVGKIYTIKLQVAGNNLTIDGSGAEEVDGATTKVLSVALSAVTIISDGTEWHIIGSV